VLRTAAILNVLTLCSACDGPVPRPTSAAQNATQDTAQGAPQNVAQVADYTGCFELAVLTDSASMRSYPSPHSAAGRQSVDVPHWDRTRRFWIHLSPQKIELEGGEEGWHLAVRQRLGPPGLLRPVTSSWRMLPPDTVTVRIAGYGAWGEEYTLLGSSDTLSGFGMYRSHVGYISHSSTHASRRACPGDSLRAGHSPQEQPDSGT
jgi:hypothetical protein